MRQRQERPERKSNLEVEVGVLQAAVGQAELQSDGVLRDEGSEGHHENQHFPAVPRCLQRPPEATSPDAVLGGFKTYGGRLADCRKADDVNDHSVGVRKNMRLVPRCLYSYVGRSRW